MCMTAKIAIEKKEIVTLSKAEALKVVDVLERFRAVQTIGGAGSTTGKIGPDDDINDFPPWIWPYIRVGFDKSQVIVNEAEISNLLTQGYTFKTQLASGKVILEKAVSIENTLDTVIEQIKKQIT